MPLSFLNPTLLFGTAAAALPTFPAGDVVSLFSNAYTNNPVDTWSVEWDDANVEDVQIGSRCGHLLWLAHLPSLKAA